MDRRGFIKLSGGTLLLAGLIGIDGLKVFNPQYPPVAITRDDVLGAVEFWTHFKIPMSRQFKDAVDPIIAGAAITPLMQHTVKVAVVKEIALSGHVAFTDSIFKGIRSECMAILKALS